MTVVVGKCFLFSCLNHNLSCCWSKNFSWLYFPASFQDKKTCNPGDDYCSRTLCRGLWDVDDELENCRLVSKVLCKNIKQTQSSDGLLLTRNLLMSIQSVSIVSLFPYLFGIWKGILKDILKGNTFAVTVLITQINSILMLSLQSM